MNQNFNDTVVGPATSRTTRSRDVPMNGMFVRVAPRRLESGHPGVRHDYFVLSAGRIVSQGRAAVHALPQTAQPVVLLLAAEDVLLTNAVVPPLATMRLRDALPNLVEDRSLADVASLHVAQLQGTSSWSGQNDAQALAVVDAAWLKKLIAGFTDAGYRVATVWPESLCIPFNTNGWSLASVQADSSDEHSRRLWLRTGPYQAHALPLDPDSARHMLRALLEQADAMSGNLQTGNLQIHASQEQMPGLLHLVQDLGVTTQSIVGDPLQLWLKDAQAGVTQAAPRSLLQHELTHALFGAERWNTWRRVAILLFALLIIQIVGMQVQWSQLRAERAALREQAARQLREAFPDTTTILDAPLQMERALADLRGHSGQSDPGDFTALVSAAGQIFSTAPVNAFLGFDYANGAGNLADSAASSSSRNDARHSLRIRLVASAAGGSQQQAEWTQRAAAAGYDLRFEMPVALSPVMVAATKASEIVALLRTKGAP